MSPLTLQGRDLVHDVIRSHSGCADPDCKPESCSIRLHGAAVRELLSAHDDLLEGRAELVADEQRLLARVERAETLLLDERKAFIRRAAIAFAVVVETDGDGNHAVAHTREGAWALAEALWDAAPEGC